MFAGTVGALIGIVVAAGALAAGSHPPTLTASTRVAGVPAVTAGHSLRLSGHDALGGMRNVILEATPFPFVAGFHPVAREQTRGSYAFAVGPTRATRYRVLVNGVSSAVVTVYVVPREVAGSCNLCSGSNPPGKHTLVASEVFTPAAGTGPIYFYYAQNSSTATPTSVGLVKTVSPQLGGGKMSVSVHYRVTFPAGPFRFRFELCRRDDEAHDGFGLPGHHHCGDATVRIGGYLG